MTTDTTTGTAPENLRTAIRADGHTEGHAQGYTQAYTQGYAEAGPATGHGRHRGPVAAHDEEGAPRGRHRKASSES
ncbi:hypothetical protein GCM10018785_63460 [Streptomyces longispororuber]|uniref:Uncharacterized protein n=1 Tax=Streptomyces longispororuber TaxID=68230 RepID=A0A919DX02_9ACTN|nr:hypothetical protein [Streptomyces longispororuber]GHE87166.1 hypothetical protein GCM10018785_63460 [Streptomyces longispororuber]